MQTKTKENKVVPGKNGQCKVSIWNNWILQKDMISEEKTGEINSDGFDLFIDRVHKRIIVRLANGKSCKFIGPIKKIEGRPLGLLMKLLKRPGKFMTPYEIGYIGDYIESYFINDNIQQYVRKLRKYLFKKKKACKPRFIRTNHQPYSIAFNGDLSFCLIEQDGDCSTDPFL
ncbi:hypothetical protein ACFL5F_03255 [Planctomycetota bacterium]